MEKESQEAIDVNFLYNNKTYYVTLTPTEIEELSSDPIKFEEFGKKLESQELVNVQQSSVMSPEPDKNSPMKITWTSEKIKLLINIRLSMNKEFEHPKCKKNKLWMEVAKKFASIANIQRVSWEECYSKYRNLLHTYKANKEKKLKSTGESSITWEYFDIFDSVLGGKASTCPQADVLSSSLEDTESEGCNNTNKNEEQELKENVGQFSEQGGSSAKGNRKEGKNSDQKKLPLKEYLFMKSEREKIQWDEKKVLKEKEIAAINNLADAIRGDSSKRRRSDDSE